MKYKFELSHEQSARINEWMRNHDCSIEYAGAIGGKYTFCFTITGIGVAEVVKCGCGKEINVTDYDSW